MASLRYLNQILTVLAVLLGLQLWTTWQGGGPAGEPVTLATPAYAAGIPNAGAQRKQLVDLMKRQNQLLSEMTALFETGRARVRLDSGNDSGE